jgi:DNA polymerase III gamma/tau subunit
MSKFEKYPLQVKYRPTDFDQIIGNETAIDALRSCLERSSGVPHTFLFQGPSGCGKTTLARIVAVKLGSDPEEVLEYNISKMRGIDTAREIIDNCKYPPLRGKIKVFILNEVHKSTNEFQNSMLEILEEPPKHVFFILVTTDPQKLIKTIRTRCMTFQVGSLQRAKILKLLKYICGKEKVEVPQTVLDKICEYCDGSPRQALVMLDQIIDITDEKDALAAVLNSTISETSVLELCQLLLKAGTSWKTLSKALKVIDDEPEKVRYAVLSYMTKTLLDSPTDRIAQIIDVFSESWMYSGKAGMVMCCYLVAKL